jgi:hypothetical protein
MRFRILLTLSVALFGAWAIAPASGRFGEVVASFRSPAPRPVALTWAEGNVCCFCQTSPYLIWRVAPESGKVLGSFKFAKTGADTAGLAYDGTYFWAGNKGTDYVYRFKWGGSVVSSFKTSWNFGQGLAWSGLHLWGTSLGAQWSHPYYLMRVDGSVISSYTSFYKLFDPAWDGEYLWVPEFDNISETYRVVGYETVLGSLIGTFRAPADEPWGTAYDGQYLWLSTLADNGRFWKFDIVGVAVKPQSLGRVKALFK